MVKDILKIAGVKSEKELYDLYPTEEAFMKAHSKQFKKAKLGTVIKKAQDGWVQRAANAEFSCGAHPRSELRRACEERYNVGGLSKAERKALKSELEASNLNGLVDYEDYYTLKNIADAHNSKMGREDKAYAKMFDPATGLLLPTATGMNNEPELRATNRWYQGRTNLTPLDIYQGILKDYNVTDKLTPKQASEWLNKAYEAGYAPPKQQQGGGSTSRGAASSLAASIGSSSISESSPSIGSYYGGERDQRFLPLSLNAYYTNEKSGLDTKPIITKDRTSGWNNAANMLNSLGDIAGKMPKSSGRSPIVPIGQGGLSVGQGLGLTSPAGGSIGNPNFGTPDYNTMWGNPGTIQSGAVMPTTPQDISGIATEGTWEIDPYQRQGQQDWINSQLNSKKPFDLAGAVGKYAGPAASIIKGIQDLKAEKEQRKYAEQTKAVSDVALKAAKSRPEAIRRRYVRPEDAIVNPNERFPTYGVGTNYLAKDGRTLVGGNPTEIQNTYNPGNIYMNLGFEPLNDSSQVKTFQYGGTEEQSSTARIPEIDSEGAYDKEGNYVPDWEDIKNKARRMNAKVVKVNGSIVKFDNAWNVIDISEGSAGMQKAQGGAALADFAGAGGGQFTNQLFGSIGGAMSGGGFNTNAGGNLGGTLGSTIGGIFGPVGGLIGGAAGSLIGGALDKNAARIKTANEATQRNTQNMALMSGVQGVQGRYSNYLQDGGYVSHNWNPQVITKFGDIDVSQMHNIATHGMDTLRTGGNITRNYTYPQDRFAFGGDLQTHWGGRAETIANNPYLPGTGDIVMFRGQSHDESDGKGRTGIGVSYGGQKAGPYLDYAEYGTDAATDQADVEVERNEPAIEGVDPQTGESVMHVLGDMTINKAAANFIGDSSVAGMKYKNAGKKYAASDAKISNKITKLIDQINDLKVNNSFDKTKLTSLTAMLDGYNAKLRKSAQAMQDMATYQGFINDTAEEHGLVAKDLAMGRVKFDKNANKNIAKSGKKLTGDPKIGEIRKIPNTEALGQFKYQIWDGSNWVDPRDYTTSHPGHIPQYDADGNVVGVTNADTGEQISTFDPGTAAVADPSARTNKKLTKAQYDELVNLYNIAEHGTKAQVEAFQKKFHEYLPQVAEDIVRKDEHITKKGKSMGYKDKDLKTLPQDELLKTNVDGIFGQRTKQYRGLLDENLETPPPTTQKQIIPDDPKKTVPPIQMVPPMKPNPWITAVNQVYPWIRETDAEALDTAQLYPEMYAMATNQLEPVQAQLFRPELDIPYDISLQDQLNANQSDFNAIQRMTGYNPAAQAALAAQKYAANQKTLGEQFRLNQAEKASVYSKNRDILNESAIKNLAILDQQYVRQAEARSKTKAVTQLALNSIADKVAKHKLENRTLQTYENLYNYRYDPRFRAVNQNPLWQPNIPNVSQAIPIYDKDGNVVGYQQADSTIAKPIQDQTTTSGSSSSTSTTSSTTTMRYGGYAKKAARNGNIVRAIKGL